MSYSENNKRVVKNTMFLYIRMFFILLIGLYTSRKALEILGVVDFGLYNVVGGVVAMFTFVSTTMSNASNRFFAYALGQNNETNQRKTFQTMWFVYLIVTFVLLILAETIGLWFVLNRLNIPTERLFAVKIVYQLSILGLLANFIRIPFNALVIAHERMGFFAYLSIIEVVLKLGVVLVLIVGNIDKLILFGLLNLFVIVAITLAYFIYCRKNFSECILKINSDWKQFKEILLFSNWNFFSTMGDVALDQGINILLNIFFNPAVNAARAISYQIRVQVRAFTGNFQTAATPQITKYCAANDKTGLIMLVNSSSRFSYFLMFVVAVPLYLTINFLLSIWLVSIPEFTEIFVKLILINVLIDATGGTLHFAILAIGDIKKYVLSLTFFKMFCFAGLLLLFKYANVGVEYSIYATITFSICSVLLQLYFYSQKAQVPVFNYIKNVLSKILIVTLTTLAGIALFYKFFTISNTLLGNLLVFILSFIWTLAIVYTIGLDKNEQKSFIIMIKKRLK